MRTSREAAFFSVAVFFRVLLCENRAKKGEKTHIKKNAAAGFSQKHVNPFIHKLSCLRSVVGAGVVCLFCLFCCVVSCRVVCLCVVWVVCRQARNARTHARNATHAHRTTTTTTRISSAVGTRRSRQESG